MSNPAFKGKVVIITGGASGIGLAVARQFAREGAAIALLDMEVYPAYSSYASCLLNAHYLLAVTTRICTRLSYTLR